MRYEAYGALDASFANVKKKLPALHENKSCKISYVKVMEILKAAGAEKLAPLFGRAEVTFKELCFADHKALRQVRNPCFNTYPFCSS